MDLPVTVGVFPNIDFVVAILDDCPNIEADD